MQGTMVRFIVDLAPCVICRQHEQLNEAGECYLHDSYVKQRAEMDRDLDLEDALRASHNWFTLSGSPFDPNPVSLADDDPPWTLDDLLYELTARSDRIGISVNGEFPVDNDPGDERYPDLAPHHPPAYVEHRRLLNW